MLAKNILDKWGIKRYFRYRDDIIFSVRPGAFSLALHWYHALKRLSGYFVLLVDETCTNTPGCAREMRYLASTLHFVGINGRIRIEPFIKTIGVALNSSSAHCPSVHSWPVNMFKTIINTSPSKSSEAVAISTLKEWLLADPLQLTAWEEAARKLTSKSRHTNGSVFWIVLPWHPSFALASLLRTAIREIHDSAWLLKDLLGYEVTIRTAWSNPGLSDYRRFNGQNMVT